MFFKINPEGIVYNGLNGFIQLQVQRQTSRIDISADAFPIEYKLEVTK
jgi:hypothetical protein